MKDFISHIAFFTVIMSMAVLTYNVKLNFEKPEDRDKLTKTLESQRLAFNYCSNKHFGTDKNSIVELHNKCYRSFRQEYPEIPSQIVVRGLQEVLSTYRAIKSNKHKIEKAPEKKNLSIRLDKRLYTFDRLKNEIKLCVVGGKRIKCNLLIYPKIQELLNKYTICDPLIFIKNDTIYLAVSFNIPETVVTPAKVIGVDLGINRLAATSEGKIIKSKSFNARKRQLRYLKRQLQSKASQGSKSAKKHLKKLKNKERNINKNFLHYLANEILKTDANVIVLEDLTKIKQNKKNKYKTKFNNKLSQVSFAELKRILIYKAQCLNKQVTVVNPKYTSQIDHRTGEKDGIRKGCRYYGKDGIVLDADINAANNIAIRSKLPVSCCKALDGQATVTKLNVCGSSRASLRF